MKSLTCFPIFPYSRDYYSEEIVELVNKTTQTLPLIPECIDLTAEEDIELRPKYWLDNETTTDLLDWALLSKNSRKEKELKSNYRPIGLSTFSTDTVNKKRKRFKVDRFSFEPINQVKEQKYGIRGSKIGRGKVLVLRE